ncbi:MAG: GNAT family N-acetyltransferase [Candidatus Acidiferrales bacterium]
MRFSFFANYRRGHTEPSGAPRGAHFTVAIIRTLSYDSSVSTAQIHIRQLAPSEAAAYREIRLEALRSSPEAFGSTFEAESERPLERFRERLTNSPVFGAFLNAELVGIAGFMRREGAKDAHKAMLWGMYVRAGSRKAGVGRRLAEAVIDFARQHVETLQLTVVSDNEPARHLYASLGFVEYGIERNALKQDGRYYDEVLMAKDLRPESK